MADENRFAQIAHRRPPVPKRERLFVPICCLCGLIQETAGQSVYSEHWMTRRMFLKSPRVEPNRLFAHAHLLSWVFHPDKGHNGRELQSHKS